MRTRWITVPPVDSRVHCILIPARGLGFIAIPSFSRKRTIVIPAKAGIQCLCNERHWVPAFARTTQVWASLDRQEYRRRESLDHPPDDPVRPLGSDLRHHVLVGDHLAELALEGKIARVACDLVR